MTFSRIKGFIDNRILEMLSSELNVMVQVARNNASWSSKIPGAISVEGVMKEGDARYVGEIKVDLKEAPEARAFEYGSGLRSERGDKETYRIPRDGGGSFVAFPKERWPGFTPRADGIMPDTFVFTFVKHPGVAARPYLKPAIESRKRAFRNRILGAFVSGYKEGLDVRVVIE